MSLKKAEYREPVQLTHEGVLRSLREGSSQEIEHALVSVALLEDDFDFALPIVLKCAQASDSGVRGTAILCLGHLARRYKRLPESPVVELVRKALVETDEYVRGQAEIAADDIEMFAPEVGRQIRS